MHYRTPMKRRILSMFLSLVCLFSLLPTSAFAASATDTVPDVITLNHCAYNTAVRSYQSDMLGQSWLHIFNLNVNGEVMTAFCAGHDKDLGNALVGKRWNNPTLVEDEYIVTFLNYYYNQEATSESSDAIWGLNSIINPWIQACVWLREEGCFDGKTQTEIIELCAKERQKIVETWDSTKTWVGATWDSTTNSNGATVWSSKQAAESLFKTDINCSVYHYDYAETTNVTTTTASGGTKVYTPENTQGIYILNTNIPLEGAKIKVKKVDADTGVALAGAEFEITRTDTGAPVETLTTGSDGTATSMVLEVGTTYTVTETKAPNGYRQRGLRRLPQQRRLSSRFARPRHHLLQ